MGITGNLVCGVVVQNGRCNSAPPPDPNALMMMHRSSRFAEGTTRGQRPYSRKDRASSAVVLGREEKNYSRRTKWGIRAVLVGLWTHYLATK